ncbi:splicing factor 3A subunit 2-like [Anguilla anguilla]|uniref:splicing factor 3A subunit 2-like n=1 Tax=Anguilla anguilla TaxID=7936 RepID=UPI0015AF252F|nr:splicing factor 3A subunit 2-like [Anguilla anguilla]
MVNTAVRMQGPAPGGYPSVPQYYPGQPGPQKMVNTAVRMQGPAPGGYPSVPQYYPGQPGPQKMGPAPGVYAPSPQCITEQPAPQNVGLSSVQPIGHGNSGIRKENSSQGTKMRFGTWGCCNCFN